MLTVRELLEREDFFDAAILRHGFVDYMRDYEVIVASRNGPPYTDVHRYLFVGCAEAVARMDRELRGAARLKPLWEDEHVALELTRTGSLWVRGEVRGFALEPQLLQFAFRTDQTALAPFAESLRACLSLAAA